MKSAFMRKDCGECVFYDHNRDFGDACVLKSSELDERTLLTWVSANDYDRDSTMRTAYDTPCDKRATMQDVREWRAEHERRTYWQN